MKKFFDFVVIPANAGIQMLSKKLFLIITLAIFIFSNSAFAKEKITILHFNDMHGNIAEGAKLATLVKQIISENDKMGVTTFVFYGGDIFSGTTTSYVYKGKAEIDLLNALGVQVAVVGNHEFDFGVKTFEERTSQAKFPFIAANMKWKKDAKPFAKDMVFFKTRGGETIGVIGIILKEPGRKFYSRDKSDFEFEDALKTMKKDWKNLDAQSDIQIALTHEGVRSDVKLAGEFPELEAVVGGHDHVEAKEYCRTVGKIPVCQTPANSTYLGKLDFEINGRESKLIAETLIPIDKKIKPDPEVAKMVNAYVAPVKKEYEAVIGFSKEGLPHPRSGETPLGDLITDVIRENAQVDVAFINTGGIRRPMSAGNITKKDILEIYPFDNKIVTMKLSGKDLSGILDTSAKRFGRSNFLQVSGVKFKIKDGKVQDVMVAGTALDAKKIYTAATIDYVAHGGDGYKFPKSADIKESDILVRDSLVDHIKKVGNVNALPLDRIVVE